VLTGWAEAFVSILQGHGVGTLAESTPPIRAVGKAESMGHFVTDDPSELDRI